MTFDIYDMELDMGDAVACVRGFATYDIEDIGIGGYEYHGSKETDRCPVAVFSSCKITDWKLIGPNGREMDKQGLTKDDIQALQEVVVEELNDNFELCCELASDDSEPADEDI